MRGLAGSTGLYRAEREQNREERTWNLNLGKRWETTGAGRSGGGASEPLLQVSRL